MDNFDIDSLEKYIRKYKRNIVNKLEKIQLTEKEMRNQCDLLCMVLDYSPRLLEERKVLEKYKIKTNQSISPTNNDKFMTFRSLNIDYKQSSNDEDSSEESKDGTIRFSRFSSKIKMDMPINERIDIAAKDIVHDIINKALEKINTELESEEDEYFARVEKSRAIRMDEANAKISNIVNSTINSRFANKFAESLKIRIYFLNTQIYYDFPVAANETMRDLKLKILSHMEKDKSKYRVRYHIIEAYELRMVDDDDDDILPNMEYPALEDKLNIIKSKVDTLAFVEKINFNPDVELSMTSNNLIGPTNTKINLKIHFKMDGTGYTVISEDREKTLRTILDRLAKNRINFKILELYYFVEHVENNKDEIEDMDNAINIETPLKFLNIFELDLYYKKFPDAPESLSYSQYSQRLVKYNEFHSTYQYKQLKNEEVETGREYIFNDITAGVFQEFEVIKINKFKSKQDRTLGIDMYNLYNDLPKNRNGNNLFNIIYGGTKKPLRKIKDIANCGHLSSKTFFIEFKLEGKSKQIVYEVKTVNVRNEIVAKIKYLIKMNQNILEN